MRVIHTVRILDNLWLDIWTFSSEFSLFLWLFNSNSTLKNPTQYRTIPNAEMVLANEGNLCFGVVIFKPVSQLVLMMLWTLWYVRVFCWDVRFCVVYSISFSHFPFTESRVHHVNFQAYLEWIRLYHVSTLYKVVSWGKIVGLSWNWRSFKTIIVSGEVSEVSSQRFSASNQTLPACYKKVNVLICIYLQEVYLLYVKTKPSYSIRNTFP